MEYVFRQLSAPSSDRVIKAQRKPSPAAARLTKNAMMRSLSPGLVAGRLIGRPSASIAGPEWRHTSGRDQRANMPLECAADSGSRRSRAVSSVGICNSVMATREIVAVGLAALAAHQTAPIYILIALASRIPPTAGEQRACGSGAPSGRRGRLYFGNQVAGRRAIISIWARSSISMAVSRLTASSVASKLRLERRRASGWAFSISAASASP